MYAKSGVTLLAAFLFAKSSTVVARKVRCAELQIFCMLACCDQCDVNWCCMLCRASETDQEIDGWGRIPRKACLLSDRTALQGSRDRLNRLVATELTSISAVS